MTKGTKVLLMTVGTGTSDDLEKTLFIPLRKSITMGQWSRVVLLPSQETYPSAQALLRELPDIAIEIFPLQLPRQENNADAAYAHFEAVIARILSQGITPSQIVADFTRGTKAMSAALVLAASRHGVPRLRYIAGRRDNRGSVSAGTEQVLEFSTTMARGHRLLDQALLAMTKGNFAAVLDILPETNGPMAVLWPKDVRTISEFARPLAEFYGAWDRLDYRAAQSLVASLSPKTADAAWQRFAPSDDMLRLVRLLAEPEPEEITAQAPRVRRIAADLLANGERRIRDQQYEDAYLRAYRVLELIGQARLFGHGLDSAQLPKDHPAVASFDAKLKKERSSQFGIDKKSGNYMAPRELVARLLKDMGDAIGKRLLELGGKPFVKSRNRSVLIHGFEATNLASATGLREIFRSLDQLLVEDGGEEAKTLLEVSRSLDFSILP